MFRVNNHSQLAKKILNEAEKKILNELLTKKILASFLINKLCFDVHSKKAGQKFSAFG